MGPGTRLLHAVGVTGAGTVGAILLGVITNKALALLIGPSGLGVVSQLTVFRALIMAIVAAGLPASLTRFVAEAVGRADLQRAVALQRAGMGFAVGLGLAMALVVAALRGQAGRWLFGADGFGAVTIACAVGGGVGGVALVVQGILNGYREIGTLAVSTAAVSFANLLLMVALGAWFGVTGAAFAVAALPLCNLVIYAVALRLRHHRLWGHGVPSLSALGAPLRVGFAALAATFLNTTTLLLSRRAVIGAFGLEGNGWYQAVLTLSDQYFNVLATSVTTYVLPTLAAYERDAERAQELNRVGRVMFLLLTPIISTMLVAKEVLLRLLYSGAFLTAAGILQWQVLGGFFRMAAWTLGSPLLVVARPNVIVAQEVLWDVTYLAGILLLPRWAGLAGIGMAFVAASALHAAVLGWYMSRRIGFRWSPRNRLLLGTSLAVVLTALLAGRVGLIMRVGLVGLAVILWGLVNVGDSERTQLRELARHLLNRVRRS